MKTIYNYITESTNNDAVCAALTYLIYKYHHSGKQGENDVKYLLERIPEELQDDLFNFFNKHEWEDCPELLGDGDGSDNGMDVKEYTNMLDLIKHKEIDALIR